MENFLKNLGGNSPNLFLGIWDSAFKKNLLIPSGRKSYNFLISLKFFAFPI